MTPGRQARVCGLAGHLPFGGGPPRPARQGSLFACRTSPTDQGHSRRPTVRHGTHRASHRGLSIPVAHRFPGRFPTPANFTRHVQSWGESGPLAAAHTCCSKYSLRGTSSVYPQGRMRYLLRGGQLWLERDLPPPMVSRRPLPLAALSCLCISRPPSRRAPEWAPPSA